VLLHKKPSPVAIGIDRDPALIAAWRQRFPSIACYVEADAIDFLRAAHLRGDEVVYCDPPYVPTTRRRTRVYRYDYDRSDHVRLLEVLCGLPCRVLISGYPSPLYDAMLRGWNTHCFNVKTHAEVRLEKLWFNYDPPTQLHDARYLGGNFRERQNVRRRMARLVKRISALSTQEQHSLSEWLVGYLSRG
jgi:DNA adenine methylase